MSQNKLSRRTMFAGAACVGAAAAAVALVPPAVQNMAVQPAPALKPPPERGGGYQLTERVKQYYKSTLI